MKKIFCVLFLALSGCAFDGTYYYDYDEYNRGCYEHGVYYPHHYYHYPTHRSHHMQWGVRCHRCRLPMYRCHCH